MPALHSPANPDNFEAIPAPTNQPTYIHGVDSRRSFIPMAFQITSPIDTRVALLPHALVMHVNPQNFNETYTKKIERIQTRGGFVEQHWGDELSSFSADGVTGAFLNIYTGTASVVRQMTIAWDRYRDLYDLYRNNGSVYDPFGNVVLQGRVMLMFDRGTYFGFFETFEVEETDDTPFMFKINWNFKVHEIVLNLPNTPMQRLNSPAFQGQNKSVSTTKTSGNGISTQQAGTTADQAAINDKFNAAARAFDQTQGIVPVGTPRPVTRKG